MMLSFRLAGPDRLLWVHRLLRPTRCAGLASIGAAVINPRSWPALRGRQDLYVPGKQSCHFSTPSPQNAFFSFLPNPDSHSFSSAFKPAPRPINMYARPSVLSSHSEPHPSCHASHPCATAEAYSCHTSRILAALAVAFSSCTAPFLTSRNLHYSLISFFLLTLGLSLPV